jgi:hypothetical protein
MGRALFYFYAFVVIAIASTLAYTKHSEQSSFSSRSPRVGGSYGGGYGGGHK